MNPEIEALSKRLDQIERILGSVSTDDRELFSTRTEHELAESIKGMNVSAERLVSALHSVEESQRELVSLRQKTNELTLNKAESSDVDVMKAKHEHDLIRMRTWISVTAIAAVLLLGLAVVAFANYNTQRTDALLRYNRAAVAICEQREAQSGTMRQFLDSQAQGIAEAKGEATPAQIARAERELALLRRAFPEISCEPLKQ